jgi:hypothetical protein
MSFDCVGLLIKSTIKRMETRIELVGNDINTSISRSRTPAKCIFHPSDFSRSGRLAVLTSIALRISRNNSTSKPQLRNFTLKTK